MLEKTRKELSISGLAAENKTYDGTRAATISNYGTLNGILSFDGGTTYDDVFLNTGSLSSSATFGSKMPQMAKPSHYLSQTEICLGQKLEITASQMRQQLPM